MDNLVKISGLKCIALPKEYIQVWQDQIKLDTADGKIINIQKGFDKLLTEKAFGGLDYAIFLEGASKDNKAEAAEQWIAVLNRKPITDKTKRILQEFGGNQFLSNLEIRDILRCRKDFINAYTGE